MKLLLGMLVGAFLPIVALLLAGWVQRLIRRRRPPAPLVELPDDVEVPGGLLRFTAPLTEAEVERIKTAFLRGGPVQSGTAGATWLPGSSREWIDRPLHPELFDGPPRPAFADDDAERTLNRPEPSSGTDPKGPTE